MGIHVNKWPGERHLEDPTVAVVSAKDKRLRLLGLYRVISWTDMAALNTLPVELILDIVKELVLDNENRTSVGENASWTSLTTYHGSLKRQELSPLDESDPLPRSPYEFSIYEDLCSLRL